MKTAAKLSRSGRTNPFGKCDAELKVKIDSAPLPACCDEEGDKGVAPSPRSLTRSRREK